MQTKSYKNTENTQNSVNEPAVAYRNVSVETSSLESWNPNIPFHGTQEQWWEHFRRIEEGPFYPVSDVHKRVSQWLEKQKP